MSSRRILVLGGTGFVGRQVCEQLARLGWQVTVPTRRAVNAAAIQNLPGLTVVEASVHSASDLARLMPGHDAVVNLVAVLHGDEQRFEQVHVPDVTQVLPTAVVNYPNDHAYTRETEWKQLTGQQCQGTTLTREYPCAEGEPFYPVPNDKNQALLR